MAFIDRLKEARLKNGLTQEKLAKEIGVAKSTYTGYEKGNSEPNMLVLSKIMDVLGVDANYLYQDEVRMRYENRATPEEMEKLVKKYRLIDPEWQEAVDGILEIGYRQYEAKKQAHDAAIFVKGQEPEVVQKRMTDRLVYTNPAAAGTPLYAESDFERMQFPEDDVPYNADFGIRISGRSMEPTVMDGSIAWVHKTAEVRNGDVAIFMLNDSAVCKRFYRDDNGSIRLESDNPGFGPVRVTEFDNFVLVGEVVGTI